MHLLHWLACGEPGDGTDGAPTAVVPVDCTTLGADFPEPRGDHAGAWDPGRGRLVVFGGDVGVPVDCQSQTDFTGETWAWVASCGAWQRIEGEAPTARGRHIAAVHDGALIVHGGRFRNGTSGAYKLRDDTWSLDLATDTWTLLATSDDPKGRSSHAGAFVGDDLVVFGGNASTDGLVFEPLGDVQRLDVASGAWSKVVTSGRSPTDRLFHAAASDGGRLYVFGGGDEGAFTGPFFNDLWVLDVDLGSWEELHDGSGDAPLGRIQANLEWDGTQLLLWGGHDDGTLGNSNELWSFSLDTGKWKLLETGDVADAPANGFCDFPVDFTTVDVASPERRSSGAAAIDGTGRLWVMGGKSDCGSLDDVWSWREGWTNDAPASSGESCTRASASCSSLCF